MIVAATFISSGNEVYLCVNRTYSYPQYYWGTTKANAEVYRMGDPRAKVRSKRLNDQVVGIRAVD